MVNSRNCISAACLVSLCWACSHNVHGQSLAGPCTNGPGYSIISTCGVNSSEEIVLNHCCLVGGREPIIPKRF